MTVKVMGSLLLSSCFSLQGPILLCEGMSHYVMFASLLLAYVLQNYYVAECNEISKNELKYIFFV